MRLSRSRYCLGLCLMLLQAGSFSAYAQQAAKDAPPRLEKLEEGEAPAVTIRATPNKGAVTEKRAAGGKRTEVKVTTGNSTYYLKPNDQAGSALPGDGQSSTSRPAQWQVLTFDANRDKKEQQAEAAQTAPAPPPLTPAASKPAPNNK